MQKSIKKYINIAILSLVCVIIIDVFLILCLFAFRDNQIGNLYMNPIFNFGIFILVFALMNFMNIKSEIIISNEEMGVIIERLKNRRFKGFYNGEETVYYRFKLELNMGMEIRTLHNENGTMKLIVPIGYKNIFKSNKALIIQAFLCAIFFIIAIIFART